MDMEWKEIWIEALRSGAYEQGRGLMCAPKFAYFQPKEAIAPNPQLEFCCLGVLRSVASDVENIGDAQAVDMNFSKTQLTLKESEYYGITNQEMNQLIDLNDGKQWNFDQIATYIAAEL